MKSFVSIGSVGNSRQNEHGTGARGYVVRRKGTKVECLWGGVYVLGANHYVWRRAPAVTPYSMRTEAAARAKVKALIAALQSSSRGYVPLGPRVTIHDRPDIRKELIQVRRHLIDRAKRD